MRASALRLLATVAVGLVACTELRSSPARHDPADEDAGPASEDDAGDQRADGGATDGAATTCIDTTSDPANCGTCGHECVGGLCAEGRCVPRRIELPSSGKSAPRMLAGLGHLLLLRSGGELTLDRTNAVGRTTVTIGGLNDLAVDVPGKRVFARIDGALHEASLAPGSGPVDAPSFKPVAPVAPNRLEPYALGGSQALRPVVGWAFDDSAFAYQVVGLDGGLVTIAKGAGLDCDAHWSSGDTLYYVAESGKDISARSAATGATTVFRTEPYVPCSPVAVGSALIFSTYVDPNYAIVRRSTSSPSLTTLATVPQAKGPPPLVAGNAHAFWAIDGTIYRASAGGGPETFIEASGPIRGLTYGDGQIFWLLEGGEVWAVAE